MKYEDLMKKLENLKTPEIELAGHKRALRMALLSSRYFRKRISIDWAKMLAPVAATVLLIAVAGFFAAIQPSLVHFGGNQIDKFASYQQLRDFVKGNAQYVGFLWKGSAPSVSGGRETYDLAVVTSEGYSTTNIQVAGVDEVDIVKTDGEYIYLASGNKTLIVKAYPPEQAQILSQIELEGTVIGIFINHDRLVVIEEKVPYYPYYDVRWETEEKIYMPYISPKTFIKVYDVSDRANPQLQREISANGQYVSSRMIGDYAYVVVNEPVYEQDNEVNLPKICVGVEPKEIPATEIYYSDVSDRYYMYTTIIAINTQNDGEEPAYETILLGASSNLYVSLNNIYLTFPVWGTGVGDFDKTSIHRIEINGAQIEPAASGEVPGMVLSQFSMDEYDGYFRVATTTHALTTQNNVYILDTGLNIVGVLEGLASGETIYSARFMGDRCYLVTFRQVDPLFVIDLSNPSYPEELGYLKITGYSSYLHPYDENHLIGIGKETTEQGEFAWYQGVKIALFDVSNVSQPTLIDTEVIGHRGTESPVLWDHKAFLFDKSRNLLVIPILEAKVDTTKYSEQDLVWAYGEPVWQGAYVFNIYLDAGIGEKGKITHIENIADPEQAYQYFWSPFVVTRSLYIDDVLYTISDAKIKMNNLENLEYINEVELPSSDWVPYEYLPGESRSEEPSAGAESGGK